MNKRYLFGVLVAIIVLLVNQLVIQYWLSGTRYDAVTINIAGKQRMLSQKVALEYAKIVNGKVDNQDIQHLLLEWKEKHHSLIYGNKELNIKGVEDVELNAKLQLLTSFMDKADYYISAPREELIENQEVFFENQELFLAKMDSVVKELEVQANGELRWIVIAEILLFLISILVIVLEVQYIYLPIEKKLKLTIERMKQSQKILKGIYDSTEEAFVYFNKSFRVEFSNKAAEALFKTHSNVNHLITKTKQQILTFWNANEVDMIIKDLQKGLVVSKQSLNGDKVLDHQFFPVITKGEVLMGYAYSIKDVTSILTYQRELELKKEQLDKIAWNQSHSVKEPLAAIQGLINMVKSGEHFESKQFLSFLEDSVKRLDIAVRKVIDITRVA